MMLNLVKPIQRLFGRNAPGFSRAATRYTCAIDGALVIIERMLSIDGRLIDFSKGGAMFRPRLAYIMYRRDDPVCLQCGELEIFGRIMSTTPGGFGVRFDSPLEDHEVQALLELNGGDRLGEAPVYG